MNIKNIILQLVAASLLAACTTTGTPHVAHQIISVKPDTTKVTASVKKGQAGVLNSISGVNSASSHVDTAKATADKLFQLVTQQLPLPTPEIKAEEAAVDTELVSAKNDLFKVQMQLSDANTALADAQTQTATVQAQADQEHTELVSVNTQYNQTVVENDALRTQVTKDQDSIKSWRTWAWRWGAAVAAFVIMKLVAIYLRFATPAGLAGGGIVGVLTKWL